MPIRVTILLLIPLIVLMSLNDAYAQSKKERTFKSKMGDVQITFPGVSKVDYKDYFETAQFKSGKPLFIIQVKEIPSLNEIESMGGNEAYALAELNNFMRSVGADFQNPSISPWRVKAYSGHQAEFFSKTYKINYQYRVIVVDSVICHVYVSVDNVSMESRAEFNEKENKAFFKSFKVK
ncbi:MAG: hypothetical protein ACJAVN_002592 [Roseivirga sp.]|jgi:hypothetical protein